MGRVLKGDPGLYAEIQTQNLQGAGIIQEYLRIAGEVGRALMQGDASHFAQTMSRCAEVFGSDFLAHAVDTSNAIQEATSIPLSRSRLT
jgi:prephenate dehydrogenase